MDFLNNVVKTLDNANILSDGGNSSEFSGTIDTGSYILNAAISGSIYGGVPDNKITAFAGESATGKTFFVLGILKQFLDANKEGGVIYFDTEAAVTKSMMEDRGIDSSRVAIVEPSSIEEFRTTATRILTSYLEDKDQPPMMMVLDSLGMLSSNKELEDTESGKNARDMTKAQLLRGTFRVLSLKLAKAKVPLLVTNHVYDVVGSYVPMKEISGGCLTSGTKVLTSTGLVSIEDIEAGASVMTKEGTFEEVLQTHQFDDKELLEIQFEDGYTIKCSHDHKFLVGGEWVRAIDLDLDSDVEVSDASAAALDRNYMKINHIKEVASERVYDISVDNHKNYILENGVITHNSGLKYSASSITMLSKKKDKEGNDIVGNIIKVRMHKSRFTKENKTVEVKLSYDSGLDRYYGLLDLAEKYEIIKKVSTRYEMPDGTKVFGKAINNEPEKYFTPEIMQQIEEAANKEFMYGVYKDEQPEETEE